MPISLCSCAKIELFLSKNKDVQLFLLFTRFFVAFPPNSEYTENAVVNLVLYWNYSKNTLSASTVVSINMVAFA